jgi:IS5 family transposase
MHKTRYGYYLARILADKLFRTRENYRFCKANNIHVSNFRLGLPPKNLTQSQNIEERIDEGLRNEVEGEFGTGKRKYTLKRILTRLPETTATQVVLAFLVMNLDKLYRDFPYSFFKEIFFYLIQRIPQPPLIGRFNVK